MNLKGLFCVCLLVALSHYHLFAQDRSTYFIVIGAYDSEANAKRALIIAEENNLPARYARHPQQSRFYVYVRVVTDVTLAKETMRSVRAEGYAQAWIFGGMLLNPVTLAAIEPAGKIQTSTLVADSDVQPEAQPSSQIVTPTRQETIEPVTATENPQVIEKKPAPEGRPFVFQLVDKNSNMLKGVVRLQESDRAQQFRPVAANETVYIPAPTNRAGRWYVACDVVGFKPYKVQFSYKDAAKSLEVGPGGEFVLSIDLIPVRKGDYIEFERVKFLNNSNIFHPDSRQELDELAAMMTNNIDYRIRIHGHTNGNDNRNIIEAESTHDIFSADASNKQYEGTAKQLSLLRAESVKRFLVQHGIAESRITTKGEAGKQMLYEGTLASMNDRVEVEIVKH